MGSGTRRTLDEICANDVAMYGSKAAALGELSKSDFDVPAGFVLPAECVDSFLRRNGFPYRPADYAAYSSEIRQCLQGYAHEPELVDSLERCTEDLLERYPQDRIIVRTSALCEDRETSSMAGVFESFPGLSSLEEVQEAVIGCYRALFSDAVIDRHAAGLIADHELKAGVIIQRYVAGEVSGVMFTADTKDMDPGTVKISADAGERHSFLDDEVEDVYSRGGCAKGEGVHVAAH